MTLFYQWDSTSSRLEALRGGSLIFATKFQEIPGTHFIDLRWWKDWVDPSCREIISWFPGGLKIFINLLICSSYASLKCSMYNMYNPSQNIWHEVKKYRKIEQDFKNIISNFAPFLTAIVNV